MAEGQGSPQVIAGRYVLYGVLARGGMATVHLGRMLGPAGFSRTVALKRLHEQFAHDPHFVSGLLDEARLSARIGHPNVIPTLDVVATDEHLLLVMEYVQGESLSRLMHATARRNAKVAPRIAVGIMAGVLHGLHAAHEAESERGEPLHIVHRDVSPQNVLVGVDGVPRVLDFGVAKAAFRLQETLTGQLKGKLSYMAPEQVQAGPIDRRTDVFAASIVLWEVLTAGPLFSRESEGAAVHDVLHAAIAPPSERAPGLPAGLDAIVLRGLSRAPGDRFQTAREMALALEDLIPPATANQIGEWVKGLAEKALAERAQSVRDVESATSDIDAITRTVSTGRLPAIPSSSRALQVLQELPTAPPAPVPIIFSVADAIARRLSAYLGPHTAKVAVKTFSMRALGRTPETLIASDVPTLLTALRPMLRTFIGRAQCEQVLESLSRELAP